MGTAADGSFFGSRDLRSPGDHPNEAEEDHMTATARAPMNAPTFARGGARAAVWTALTCLVLTALSVVGLGTAAAASAGGSGAPIAKTDNGAVRGTSFAGGVEFLGVPYAAPPVGRLRWQPPQPASDWKGVRDATAFAPSCPQPAGLFTPAGALSEDCLYLNVYTPALDDRGSSGRPVLVWIHGGGLTLDGARSYDPTQLAAEGTVVVTINYRLGVLGFLAHPALASRQGGPAGNYGLMDQQAALRWVRSNIDEFGGNADNVTIAGQSAGGLSVLAHLVSHGSRGLFQKAIVQSGTFALEQQSLADAEEFGQAVAKAAGCANQTAKCLRSLPVDALVGSFPPFAIPGVVDGKVLTESIGTALAGGRFARVPVLNGSNQLEELVFVAGQNTAVSGGTFVPLDPAGITDANYLQQIKSTLGVSDKRAAAIAQEYPTAAYPSATIAFTALVGDANFACTALQVDKWTSAQVPTFAYEFNDPNPPARYAPIPVATHTSELPYLFELPNAPLQVPLTADQQELAAKMRAAWAGFAASGDPSTRTVPWPSFRPGQQGLSLVSPQPQVDDGFAARHHCGFWSAG
jgi:para-nitrobenzyl esterase